MKKQLLLFILTLLPMLAMADDSGSCGDNLTWTYNSTTKTLTIQGSGAMTNYDYSSSAPWRSYRTNIKTVIIEEGVTSIGNEAFSGCSGLTSVTIPNSVTSIGYAAFSGCSSLTSITIPNSVTSIGYHAFEGCSGLTSVTIPNSVTTIGQYAFRDCSGLTSVTIPNSVTSIGYGAFSYCSGLTSITIGNSVASIGESAFSGCSGLQKVVVPNIAAWCGIYFGNYESNPLYYAHHIYSDENTEIKDLVIPNSVTSIGNFAFINCSNLTSVTIPNSVSSIGSSAFQNCTGFTSLTIPSSITSISNSAFSGCSSLTSVEFHCAQIGSWFSGMTSIKAVTIGNEVTSIGQSAFYGCSGLTSVIIPNSVTSIGSAAFEGCSGLTSITIPNSVTSIGSYAFSGCSGLNSITIPNSVTSIGWYAFRDCSGLTSITIPNSVTSIGSEAFQNCSGLQKVIVPDIAAWCGISFSNFSSNPLSRAHHIYSDENTEITDLVIPDGVTSIGNYAFSGCSGLTSVTIPNSVTTIGQYAFRDCSGLTSVTIPNSVVSIGYDAFYGCSGLSSVEFHCAQIGSWFSGNKSIKEIVIGNEVTSIGNQAFKGCSGLTSVTIGNSVTSIGDYAFEGCSGLSSVEFHCAQIGSWFSNMTSIKEVTIGNEVTSMGNQAFKGCSGLQKVIVPNISAWCGFSFLQASDNPLYYVHHIYSDENTEITDLVIPNSVTSIGDLAFINCSSLTSVTIGNGVTSIGYDAFYGCSGLMSVTIGSGVTSIGKNAFSCGIKLSTVNVNMNIPIEIDESVFEFTGENYSKDIIYLAATLNVPIGSKALYSNVKGWKKFMNINEVDFTPKHKLVYVVDGAEYKVYEIAEGATITPEPAPTKEGYTFSGWSEIPETMPAHDVTVTGTFSINKYKMTYKVDGVEYKSYELEYGATITPEPAPTKEGYTFSGWSEIPETMPAHDVTVTGTFSINKYKLTYKVDGVEYKSYELEYGATITPEPAPTKEGYTFSGWSEIPETMPAYDVTVTGTFSINKYKLTYMVDGTEYKTYELKYGATITPEPAPTKEGYTFSGWSEIPETMPSYDVTVTGSFAVNQYLITYMIGDEVYQKEYVDYGATIVLPNVPEREGYSFAWIDAPEKMPAHDITINGAYTSGMWGVSNDDATTNTYTISGYKTDKPRRGVNIIRMSDGTTRKVVVK